MFVWRLSIQIFNIIYLELVLCYLMYNIRIYIDIIAIFLIVIGFICAYYINPIIYCYSCFIQWTASRRNLKVILCNICPLLISLLVAFNSFLLIQASFDHFHSVWKTCCTHRSFQIKSVIILKFWLLLAFFCHSGLDEALTCVSVLSERQLMNCSMRA